MKFAVLKSKVAGEAPLHMTSNKRLEKLLATDATTHLEIADALLEAIRCIDECWGTDLEWEPEMEITWKVMAEMCLFMLPPYDDDDVDFLSRSAENKFEQRLAEAYGVYGARCEHRFTLRARSIGDTKLSMGRPEV